MWSHRPVSWPTASSRVPQDVFRPTHGLLPSWRDCFEWTTV